MHVRSALRAHWFGRALVALGLAASLLTWVPGTGLVLAAAMLPLTPGPVLVRADEHEPDQPGERPTEFGAPVRGAENIPVLEQAQPVGRLEFELKRITIHDDSEPFYEMEGEYTFTLRIWEVTGDCAPDAWYCYGGIDDAVIVKSADLKWSASIGIHPLNRVVPGAGDWVLNDSIGPGIGFPVYAGKRYGYKIEGIERDPFDDDEMGDLVGILSEQNGWGPLGTATERGWRDYHTITGDYCVRLTPEGCARAYFSAEYEIRRAAVPDLEPTFMKVTRPTGADRDTICVAVLNREVADADPFWVSLRVNGQVRARQHFGGLASGQFVEPCMADALPPSAELVATVDEEQAVVEYNEANNRLVQPYTAPQGASAGGPATAPTGGATQADLVALGLRVTSAEPGGGQDCDPGKNDVTVVIKNDSPAAAAGFAVRLVIDDEDKDAKEKSVAGLAAGEQAEVMFEDVRLKQGKREIEATVDAKKTIAESDEDNNRATIGVNCRAG
jgi:hypothetical protein